MEGLFDKEYIEMSDSQEVVCDKSVDDYNYLPDNSFEDRQSEYGSDEGSMEYEVKSELTDNVDESSQPRENSGESNNTQELIGLMGGSEDQDNLQSTFAIKTEDKKKEVKSKKELEEEEREKMQ